MAKRALVIGSQIIGLRGVEHDVRRMAAALAARGFAVDARTGADASRAGILDGHAALTAASQPGDAAVVYYSGHGGRVINTDPRAGSREHPDVPRQLQLVVPTDYEESTDDDFRGISGWELSLLLADLTARTRNATVILDCCHSAQMTRDGAIRGATPRALPHPKHLGIARYLDALRAGGARLERLSPTGNPDAVRLFACADSQSAWEYPNADGHPGGALTEALLELLAQAGDAVTWAVLGRAIRERVLRTFPAQRPELGGPVGRAVFSLDEPARSDAVPVATSAGRVVIRAGRIAGVTAGDVYAVMPLAATGPDPARRLATATVTAVGPLDSEVALTQVTAPGGGLPAGALAIPVQRAIAPLAVRVAGTGSRLAEVRAAIEEAPRLTLAAPGDPEATLAVVSVADGSLRIVDPAGDLLGPLPLTGSGARETILDAVRFLADLAVAASVRELEGGHGLAADTVAVDWGTVVDGAPIAQPAHGALLGLGDRIFVRIENRGPAPVHAHVFNIGTGGKLSRLTSFATLGVPLPSGHGYTLGAVDGVGVVGLGLTWPRGLPRDTPRRDEIVVIATSQPVDLGGLETDHRGRGGGTRGDSGPRAVLEQVRRGGVRGLAPTTAADGFLVARRSFELAPTAGRVALAAGAFLVDDNPTGMHAALAPRAWAPARPTAAVARGASPLTIRLADLVIDASAGLGAGDVRVDSLVCTRAAGAPPCVVQTLRLGRPRAGERLDLGAGLLFRGAVGDFVDAAVWLSAASEAAPLEQLLAEATSAELQQAMATLGHVAAVDLPWIGAVGASAVLIRAAHDVLGRACATSVGLYRGSFLAAERFGEGRHPATGLRRGAGVAFAIEVERDRARSRQRAPG
jgi:hypothetical protein